MKRTILAPIILAAVAYLGISPAIAQTYNYSVLGTTVANPEAALIQAQDARLYGTALDLGNNKGLDFNLTLGSSFNYNVYSFGALTDGGLPIGSLVQGADGGLFGTASSGGTNGFGVLYRITGNFGTGTGTETPVFAFTNGNDGANPQGPLIIDNAGILYGTAPNGGQNGGGALFKYNPASNLLSPIYEFCAQANCSDGSRPVTGLVQGTDGNLYGTTRQGGAANGVSSNGVAYKVTTSGTYTVLHQFCTAANCPDGAAPVGPLVEYSDGNFYGMTAQGGAHNAGTVFKMTSAGTLSTLYSFTGGADGGQPAGALIVGSDGNFYGATKLGGSTPAYGTVFKMTPAGTLTTLYTFIDFFGGDTNPLSGLLQASDGNFYGTTSGFVDAAGKVYQVAASPALAPPVQLSFTTASVAPNTAATLNWKVLNAFSRTMQSCYAYLPGSPAGAGTWSGLKAGTYDAATTLFSGSASVTPTAAGTYTYALTCGGQESGFATLAVGAVVKAAATVAPTVALSATPNPAPIGQPITITAMVSGSGATPTGSVTINYGTRSLTTLPLTSGAASFSPSTAGLPAGDYVLTASYTGDANYNASVSSGYTVTLSKQAPTVSLSATPNPASVGQALTITAAAAGAGAVPTGTISFKYGALTLASLPLTGGTASFSPSTASLPANTYNLTASYSGDANYAAADSASYPVTLTAATTANTAVAFAVTPSTFLPGTPCTMTATVTRLGVAGTPTGSVQFISGGSVLATVALNAAGIASRTVPTTGVPVGYYPVKAKYLGDGSNNGSTSAAILVYVRPPGY